MERHVLVRFSFVSVSAVAAAVPFQKRGVRGSMRNAHQSHTSEQRLSERERESN